MIYISKIIIYIFSYVILLFFFTFLNHLYAKNIDIYAYETKNNIRLILSSNDNFSSKVFTLKSPTRLVVDIKNINSFSKKSSNFNYIKNIRASKTDNKARLVFDLRIPIIKFVRSKFIIKKNNNNLLIIDLIIDYRDVNNSKENKIIVIDAGHGGADPGAIRNNIKEKNLTLIAAKLLKNNLEKRAFTVFLTRQTDKYIRLKNRVKFARNRSADLFISLHADSTKNKNTNGISIYSLSEKASDRLSQALADRDNRSDLIAGLNLKEVDKEVSDILIDLSRRQTKNSSIDFAELFIEKFNNNGLNLLKRPHRQAGFAVLKAPDVPSILIEMGFISNNSDLRKLRDSNYQKILINNIALVVEDYFRNKR